MKNVLGDDLPVGIYRLNKLPTNLKIKVRLKQILNVCLEERASLDLQDSIELSNLVTSPSKEIEHIFSWQEKNQIHDVSSQNKRSDSDNVCLISLSDSDIFDKKWKSIRSSTSPSTSSNHIENMIINIKSKRFLLQSQSHKTWQKPFFLHTKELVKTQACDKRTTPFPLCQSMVIIAHLDYEDSPREEVELCYLRIDEHGVLTVVPDFCKDKPYIFLNSRSETFQYSLENVLDSLSNSKAKAEGKKGILKTIKKLHKKRMNNLVGNEFFMPPPKTVLCCLNCEIVSATNFLAKDIFIHYKFEIPDGCNLKDDSYEGVTQTCRTKKKYQNTVAYFGYIFSQELEIDLEKFQSNLIPKLQFIIEVTSVDKWGNFRNEGYGFSEIVLKSGISIVNISTWMLRPTSLTNQLRHFFIGGTPCLESLSYVRVPSNAQESELCKYGLRTESSGEVTVKFSAVLHSNESVG